MRYSPYGLPELPREPHTRSAAGPQGQAWQEYDGLMCSSPLGESAEPAFERRKK